MVFGIHPNEFINESDKERIINRRTQNFLNYLLADLLRSKLKTRNLGLEALSLYEKLIKFYIRERYNFTTVKDFCIQNSNGTI